MYNDYLLVYSGNSSDSTINRIASLLTVFFLAVILAASVILIYNIFNLSFEERCRYLGMLCSIGATGKQKRASVYFEAASLFFVALPVGIGLGIGVIYVGMLFLQPFLLNIVGLYNNYQTIPVTLLISFQNLLYILLVGFITVMISAALPARKISKVGPFAALCGNDSIKIRQKPLNEKRLKRTGVEGILAYNGLKVRRSKTNAIERAIIVFFVILVVTSVSAGRAMQLVEYRMGGRDTLAINEEKWDYTFLTMNGMPADYQEIKKEIQSDSGVEKMVEWQQGMFTGEIPFDVFSKEYKESLHKVFNLYYHRELTEEEFNEQFADNQESLSIIAVDDDSFKKIIDLTDTNKNLLKEENPAIVIQDGEVSTENWSVEGKNPEKYQFYQIEKMTDLKPGETIPMQIYSLKKDAMVDFPLTIAGYATNAQLKDYLTVHSEQMFVIVSIKTADAMNEILGDGDSETDDYNVLSRQIFIKINDKGDSLINRLIELSEDDSNNYMLTVADYEKTLQESIQAMIEILLIGFVLLSSIVCLLNLYNSIYGRMVSRLQEFATLKSVGATNGQIKKMTLYGRF